MSKEDEVTTPKTCVTGPKAPSHAPSEAMQRNGIRSNNIEDPQSLTVRACVTTSLNAYARSGAITAWALAAYVALTASCAPGRTAVLYGPDEALTAADYDPVLRTWTRSAQIYRGLDNKLFVTATFHSPEFRRAFAVAFPDIYGHGGKITRRELVDLTGGVEQYHNFFLSVHTPDTRWNDLAKNDSIWHLTLRGSGEASVSAEEVVPIKMDENLRAVYPYINRFDKVYLARFPLTDPMHRIVIDASTTSFSLRIASALGLAEMTWQLGSVPTKSSSSGNS